jgi:hypothetical protein
MAKREAEDLIHGPSISGSTTLSRHAPIPERSIMQVIAGEEEGDFPHQQIPCEKQKGALLHLQETLRNMKTDHLTSASSRREDRGRNGGDRPQRWKFC